MYNLFSDLSYSAILSWRTQLHMLFTWSQHKLEKKNYGSVFQMSE